MKKTPYIIGNWKMHKTSRQAADYMESLLSLIQGVQANIFLAVPYTAIASLAQLAKNTKVAIGAQNMNDAREGAFTGEIAGLMLKEAGASFVMIGHSERRTIFKETNEMIHRKLIRALQDDLKPVLCIGETLVEREEGKTESVLHHQLASAFKEVPKEEAEKAIIAYEPVWAIGTGKSADAQTAWQAHEHIRSVLIELFGDESGKKIPILYGGSVKPENAKELMQGGEVDGVLVGGASLDPAIFAKIALSCTGSPE